MKCETQTLELKSAQQRCPKRLYDSLSSFSNQDEGGMIIFGIDEKQDYKEVGVYAPQDIQKKINEQCLQMEPEFMDERGNFIVKFYKGINAVKKEIEYDEETNNLILFCKTPRTRKEISEYLGLSSVTYAIQTHIMPLVEAGKIKLSIPDKPKSPKQLYYSE